MPKRDNFNDFHGFDCLLYFLPVRLGSAIKAAQEDNDLPNLLIN